MVIDMNLDFPVVGDLCKFADPCLLACIDKDKGIDGIVIDLLHLLDVKEIERRMDEEITQRLLLRTRENEGGIGVELLRREHGREGIEICVHMGRDNLHSLIPFHGFLLSLRVAA